MYGTKVKSSYTLILNIVKLGNKDIRFATSNLVFSEIYCALCDEAICKKMWEDGVPLNSWKRLQEKFVKFLKDSEREEIKNAVNELKKEKNIYNIKEYYDFDLISELILYFGLKTQDSILFSTSLKNKCSYFITSDEQDFHNNEKLIEKFKDKITILTPEEAIRRFFSKPKT